jgi:hypothetical protein
LVDTIPESGSVENLNKIRQLRAEVSLRRAELLLKASQEQINTQVSESSSCVTSESFREKYDIQTERPIIHINKDFKEASKHLEYDIIDLNSNGENTEKIDHLHYREKDTFTLDTHERIYIGKKPALNIDYSKLKQSAAESGKEILTEDDDELSDLQLVWRKEIDISKEGAYREDIHCRFINSENNKVVNFKDNKYLFAKECEDLAKESMSSIFSGRIFNKIFKSDKGIDNVEQPEIIGLKIGIDLKNNTVFTYLPKIDESKLT